jgi:hypothetical protein
VERATYRSSTQVLDMSKPVTVFQSREVCSPLSPVVWILGIVVTSTGLGIIWIIWFMSPDTNCTCIRQPKRSQAVTGKEINESNIGFQVESKGKKESSGDAPQNTPAVNCNLPYSIGMAGCRLTVRKGSKTRPTGCRLTVPKGSNNPTYRLQADCP